MDKSALLFVVPYFALLVLAFARHPIYGLFAYLFAFYNHPPSRWWGEQLPDWRWALIAAAVALAASYTGRVGKRRVLLETAPAKLIALYAVWMAVQNAWAVYPLGAQEGAILFAKYVVLILLIARTVDSPERVRQFFWAHVVGCFIFSWIAFDDPRFQGGRLENVGGPGVSDSNTLATHCVTGLIAAGFLLFSRSWIARVAALGAVAFIMNTIVLCGSRGAFVAMAAAGVVANVFAPRESRRTVLALSVLGALMLGLVAHEQFWERMKTTAQYGEEASANSRFKLIGPTFEMVKDYPLGVGHEGFRFLSGQYCPPEILHRDGTRSPHTTILAVIAEQGWPGLALYALLMIATLRDLVRMRFRGAGAGDPEVGTWLTIIACSLAAFAVAGLTSNYLKCEAQIWMLGLMLAIELMTRKGASRPETHMARPEAAAGLLK